MVRCPVVLKIVGQTQGSLGVAPDSFVRYTCKLGRNVAVEHAFCVCLRGEDAIL